MINSAKIDFNHNSQPQPQQQPPVEILEIFEQQEVLLWHCGSGVFLRPADEQVVALKQFQTKRDARLLRQLYTHGAWENCNGKASTEAQNLNLVVLSFVVTTACTL